MTALLSKTSEFAADPFILRAAGMAMFTVRQGKRYRAKIALGFFERIVSNDAVASRLREAGFDEVTVTGSGAVRYAEALWPGPDTTATIPDQVASIVEVVTGSKPA